MAKERIWSEKQKRIFEWGRAPELVATTLLASLMKAGCWYTGLDGKAITLANVSGGVVTVRDTRGQETKLEATSLVRRRNLVVRARAGTGKTTTVEELCKHYAPERRQYVGAFNNRIYKELAERFEGIDYVETMTLHTLGHQFIKRQWNTARLDKVGARMERLARTAAGHDAPDQMISHIIDLAGHGKNMAPFGDAESLVPIAYRFQCAPDDEWRQYGWTVQRVAQLARQVMSRALQQDGQYDFDDMLFAPVANRWVNGRYDLVVIDEAQDMNYTQLLLALKVCLPGGRIVVVGDDRQAIYGFRGWQRQLSRERHDLSARGVCELSRSSHRFAFHGGQGCANQLHVADDESAR